MVHGLTRQTNPRSLQRQAGPTDQDLLRGGDCQIHNRCVMNAGLLWPRPVSRSGWKAFRELLKFVRNNRAGSCVASPQALPASGSASCDIQIATIQIVPGPRIVALSVYSK